MSQQCDCNMKIWHRNCYQSAIRRWNLMIWLKANKLNKELLTIRSVLVHVDEEKNVLKMKYIWKRCAECELERVQVIQSVKRWINHWIQIEKTQISMEMIIHFHHDIVVICKNVLFVCRTFQDESCFEDTSKHQCKCMLLSFCYWNC